MAIPSVCPSCSARLKVPDHMAGRRVKCPKCAKPITVEAPPETVTEAVVVTEVAPPAPPESSSQEAADDQPDERRKKRKGKRRKKSSSTPKWPFLLGTVAFCLLLAGAIIAYFVSQGHGPTILANAIVLAVMMPVSGVILVISMFISSAVAGGFDFGNVPMTIFKAFCLLLVVNTCYLLPMGQWLAIPVWIFGLMLAFDLDLWEARFMFFINWAINYVLKMFVFLALLSYIMNGGHHDKLPTGPDDGNEPGIVQNDDDGDDGPDMGDDEHELGSFKYVGRDSGFPRVVGINFQNTPVTDRYLVRLKNYPELREINFTGTAITDKGLVHLKRIKTLESVNLTGTKVTDAGVKDLQKALPKCKITR